jgi:hypothetical protein
VHSRLVVHQAFPPPTEVEASETPKQSRRQDGEWTPLAGSFPIPGSFTAAVRVGLVVKSCLDSMLQVELLAESLPSVRLKLQPPFDIQGAFGHD